MYGDSSEIQRKYFTGALSSPLFSNHLQGSMELSEGLLTTYLFTSSTIFILSPSEAWTCFRTSSHYAYDSPSWRESPCYIMVFSCSKGVEVQRRLTSQL